MWALLFPLSQSSSCLSHAPGRQLTRPPHPHPPVSPCALSLSLQVVDEMGNVKFALDSGSEAACSTWLKYVRCAPSFEEQNLAACHLTGDQVSGGPLGQSAARV